MKTSFKNSYSFTKGSLVEVSSDSDGFYCVWYVAKVLVPPPFSTTNKRTERAFLLEYQTLVTDDGSKPLTEFVDSTLIRPLPPPSETDHAFEVNDVVDAFYLDGWWIGVVVKVLESSRYSVHFEHPPDFLEFKRSDLRAHWDWDGCKWVRPQKKEMQQKESETGSLKRKRGLHRKPLVKGGGAVGKILVKDCAITDVESPKIIGDSTAAEKAAKLSDTCCSTGEADLAIVKIPGNIANICKPKSMLFDGLCPPPVRTGNSVMDMVNSSGKEMEEDSFMTAATFSCPLKKLNKKQIQQKESGTGSLKRKRAECQNPLIKGKKCDGAGGAVDEMVVKDDAIIDVESPKNVEDPNGKKCDAAGSAIDEMAVKDCATIDVESPNITGESIVSEDVSTEKAVMHSDIVCNSREAEMAIVEVANKKAIIYKPISMCFHGFCPPTVVRSIFGETFNQVDEAKRRPSEFATECTVNESMSDGVLDESRCLAYVESSSILKAVESLEVFQMMPQKPHFNPLEKCKELYREGLAIGYMLTFANVVKQTSKLQVGDPRSIFNCIFEALGDLELHGFNVKTVRTRLTELQSIKERQERLKEEWKGFGDQITEQTHEQTKFKAELGVIVKEMKTLEERKAILISKMEENDSQTAELKLNLDVHNQDIQDAKLDFETLAVASW